MIHHLRGKLTELNPTYAVIDCGGIGYSVHISLNTYSKITGADDICLLTYPIFKEDSQTLFGFYDKNEREVFGLLISVSGVGANTARVILSSLSPEEVSACIKAEDVDTLKSVKGIGAKTAERIIVDLKNKIDIKAGSGSIINANSSSLVSEATTALEVLGYSSKMTNKLLNNILKEEPAISLEELIKSTLKRL